MNHLISTWKCDATHPCLGCPKWFDVTWWHGTFGCREELCTSRLCVTFVTWWHGTFGCRGTQFHGFEPVSTMILFSSLCPLSIKKCRGITKKHCHEGWPSFHGDWRVWHWGREGHRQAWSKSMAKYYYHNYHHHICQLRITWACPFV